MMADPTPLDRMRGESSAPFVNYKTTHRIIDARIDPSAIIGDGSIVWHFAIVLQSVRIGKDVSIGGRCEIGRGSLIGDRTRIGSGTFLPPNSIIGEAVFIGPNVTFTDDKHPRVPDADDPPYDAQPPIVGNGASIGAGAVILPGVIIGAGARVAAGSVVTANVPPRVMVLGSPAKERPMPVSWQPSPLAEDAGMTA